VKIAAYRFQKYGIAEGVVRTVSADSSESREANNSGAGVTDAGPAKSRDGDACCSSMALIAQSVGAALIAVVLGGCSTTATAQQPPDDSALAREFGLLKGSDEPVCEAYVARIRNVIDSRGPPEPIRPNEMAIADLGPVRGEFVSESELLKNVAEFSGSATSIRPTTSQSCRHGEALLSN
jgi:hypothetical protein